MSVGPTPNGYATEEGAKAIVERFNKRKEKMFVKFGTSPLVIGEVVSVEYDVKGKRVFGSLQLNLDITTNGKVLQSLETPAGRRIIDCELKEICLNPKPSKSEE